jgi:hypothetical protein
MMTFFLNLKNILKKIKFNFKNTYIFLRLKFFLFKRSSNNFENFDRVSLNESILKFVETLNLSGKKYLYKASLDCKEPTLYASAYAAMIFSLLNKTKSLTQEEKNQWIAYFDSFQSKEDGLFYDPVIENEIYNEYDWWGARHLALHMLTAYESLGSKPKHQNLWVKKYYDKDVMYKWLDSTDWMNDPVRYECDIDNEIMNVGCTLQYQRDRWDDDLAGQAIANLKIYLRKKIQIDSGVWGKFNHNDQVDRCRVIQFAYHILPLFFYDNEYDFDVGKIVNLILRTQNSFYGFGARYNSSACEDIDGIYILLSLKHLCNKEMQNEINICIKNTFSWIMLNKNLDGGFVFRLLEEFNYGHIETSIKKNKSGLFPTWFRLLSIAHIDRVIGNNYFIINKSPGYEYIIKQSKNI